MEDTGRDGGQPEGHSGKEIITHEGERLEAKGSRRKVKEARESFGDVVQIFQKTGLALTEPAEIAEKGRVFLSHRETAGLDKRRLPSVKK